MGATGYIGLPLYQRSREVAVAYGTSSRPGGADFKLDIARPNSFNYEVINPGDTIFLTAAISAPDLCANDHDYCWNVNVTGTVTFINKILTRGAKVVFFSSDTVYGERNDVFNEKSKCNPAAEYGAMKYEVEKCFSGNPLFKTIRLSYVFSAQDKFTRYLMSCEARKEEAELFHPFYRAVVHREDIVAGSLALAECWDLIPERVINFGGPQIISRLEFAECLREGYLTNLRFKVVEPEVEFFKSRPRIISMTSPIFNRLLGRPPHKLSEAVFLEFNTSSNRK